MPVLQKAGPLLSACLIRKVIKNASESGIYHQTPGEKKQEGAYIIPRVLCCSGLKDADMFLKRLYIFPTINLLSVVSRFDIHTNWVMMFINTT